MPDLERRSLGSTGPPVTVLGYGAMELRGPPRGREIDDADVGRLLNTVLDSGINYIDTSIDYGVSEELIGRHIAHRRDEYVLGSKCGCSVGWVAKENKRGQPHDFSRDNIVAGVEQSLRRLRTDHLDLVQLHRSLTASELEEDDVLETLFDLRKQGKTRSIGISGHVPQVSEQIALGVFDAFQMPYSVIWPEHEQPIADAAQSGAGVIVRGATARGTAAANPNAVQRHPDIAEAWTGSELDDLFDGMSAMEFAVRFAISHPGVTTAIVGSLEPSHVVANVETASKGPLPGDVLAEAKRRVAQARAGADNSAMW